MYLVLIIGHTGQGKTTQLKKMIEGKKCYIFDVNNEYPDLTPDSRGINPRMRNIDLNVKRFVETCKRLRNYNICFEDATGFLRGRQSPEVSQLLVGKRHTGNNYIILFHSINRVPPELMEMANYIYLFKTNDFEDQVYKKFGNQKLLDAFIKLKTLPNYSNIFIQMI